MTAALPGLDLGDLTRWLDTAHPGLREGELSGAVLAGGKSNLTYRVSDGVRAWALRRPPLAHVLPTAHDMAREFRVISALSDTEVPVPEPIVLCADPAVLGAPFYLMGFVDGVVLDQPALLARLSARQAARSCEALVDTLIALHGIEPDAIGLGDFGKPDNFLARQVRRWSSQWDRSQTRPLPELSQTVELLERGLPTQSAPGVVHGDYRLTNVMFRSDIEQIAAVVDWEMATLGDPLTDLGLLVVYQELAGQGDMIMPAMSAEAGFLTAEQMVERYARASGRDLAELSWYVGLGYFKLAVIAEGIHHRYLAGKTVGKGFDHFGAAVPTLLRAASRSLARDR